MSKQNTNASTQFINVLVTAIPETDAQGKLVYKTRFMPETVTIYLPDTVINYQLIDPTPAGVRFAGASVSPDNAQLSSPAISPSGKLITFSDANTLAETLNLTLQFVDSDATEFAVDPEIKNDPQPLPPLAMATAGDVDPEEPNNPPPLR